MQTPLTSSFLSAAVPFPAISWWHQALTHGEILLDASENFEKMTYRNRYYVTGSNGRMMLSIPIVGGRNMRIPMKDVRISYQENWQDKHWKTIVSCYKKSPYFEFYEAELFALYTRPINSLFEWNHKSIELMMRLLKLHLPIQIKDIYKRYYPSNIKDVRSLLKPFFGQSESLTSCFRPYTQVFSDRLDFVADCSVLDLLCCEGSHARKLLTDN